MLNRLILPDLGDAKMPTRLHASVVLAAWCGLRWGETAELRRKDVSKGLRHPARPSSGHLP
jgi:integrase